jgi:DNA-directed RNA polymerase sigma subunit (sigma70/sigma32)
MISIESSQMIAALVPIDPQRFRLGAVVLDDKRLDVQDDVGDVLDDAGNRRELVLHPLHLDARDRAALEARQQDAAQAVADRDAESPLERFGDEFRVSRRRSIGIGNEAAGKLQTSPTNSHRMFSRTESCISATATR